MKRWDVRTIALVVVMMAVVAAITRAVQIPVPETKGYIHFGDIGANFAALAFGPWLGFLIAGGGMAIADLLSPYLIYAPGTLVIHGVQAVVVAYLGQNRKLWLMFLAAIAGGIVVVGGYFLYQRLILGYGVVVALAEVPFNILQVLTGLVGVPLYMLVSRAYPPLARWAQRR